MEKSDKKDALNNFEVSEYKKRSEYEKPLVVDISFEELIKVSVTITKKKKKVK